MSWVIPFLMVVLPAISYRKSKVADFGGIIIDEEKVKQGKCKCIKGTKLCFMEGVIGALSKEQREKLCKEIEWVTPAREVATLPLRELLKYATELEKKIEELEEKCKVG